MAQGHLGGCRKLDVSCNHVTTERKGPTISVVNNVSAGRTRRVEATNRWLQSQGGRPAGAEVGAEVDHDLLATA